MSAFHRRIRRLIDRDGPHCVWCGLRMTERHRWASADHIIPRSEDGSLFLDNLVLACRPCNNQRFSLRAIDYLERCEADAEKRPDRALVLRAIVRARTNPNSSRSRLTRLCKQGGVRHPHNTTTEVAA